MAEFRREVRDTVLAITFTRDEKLNAINPAMRDALRSAVEDLAEDDDLQVLLIAAEGRYFTAGVDIKALNTTTRGMDRHQRQYGTSVRRDYRRLHLLMDEFEAVEKPVVIAFQGPCLGLGVEMAASCDFRLAARSARFALPEVSNLAVIPGSGGISRLTRIVGPHWARWLALACMEIDADQALSMGLVHQVIDDERFMATVWEFVTRVAALPRDAVGAAKLAIDAAADVDTRTARTIDRLANTALLLAPEHLDRIEAFNQNKHGG